MGTGSQEVVLLTYEGSREKTLSCTTSGLSSNGTYGTWSGKPGVTLYVTGKEIKSCFMSVKYYCYLLGVWISHEKDDQIRISIHGHDTTQEKMHVDKKRFSTIRFDLIQWDSMQFNNWKHIFLSVFLNIFLPTSKDQPKKISENLFRIGWWL